jgi:hypothetical protein
MVCLSAGVIARNNLNCSSRSSEAAAVQIELVQFRAAVITHDALPSS